MKTGTTLIAPGSRFVGIIEPVPADGARVIFGRGSSVLCDEGAGVTIRCVKGVLWITQTGDGHDYIIEPGGSFFATAPGVVAVSAIESAVAEFSRTPGAATAGVVCGFRTAAETK